MNLEESTKIKQIDATCYIENAWRMNHEAGEYELIKIDWTDFELPNGFEWHLERFEKTLQSGGKAFGCFDDDTLAGYATLDAGVFGRGEKYVLLDQMFVSKDYRGKGIGKELISLCSRQALKFGAKKSIFVPDLLRTLLNQDGLEMVFLCESLSSFFVDSTAAQQHDPICAIQNYSSQLRGTSF